MCPAPLCFHRLDGYHLGARSPVAVTPQLVGWASVRDWAHLGLLDDHFSNCHNLACVGYVHQVSVVAFIVTHKLSFQCLGFTFADISFPLPHEDCATKIRKFFNWKLRFFTSHQLCSAFFFFTTNLLILVAWRISAPHIILGRPESMSKHLAISSIVLLHLSANPFCCGVSGMVFSCRMPACKQYILNCSERNSFALSCLNLSGVFSLRTNFFRLASAHSLP